jgi:hypothetical protein
VVLVLLAGGLSDLGKTTLWLGGIGPVRDFDVVFAEDSIRFALDFSPFLTDFGFFLIGLSVPSESKIPSG